MSEEEFKPVKFEPKEQEKLEEQKLAAQQLKNEELEPKLVAKEVAQQKKQLKAYNLELAVLLVVALCAFLFALIGNVTGLLDKKVLTLFALVGGWLLLVYLRNRKSK